MESVRRSGCGLQAELAHFASTVLMNLTVSSLGDPHRDSCATLGKANPPSRDSASPKIEVAGTRFTAFCGWFVFHRYCGRASSSPDGNGGTCFCASRFAAATRKGNTKEARKRVPPAANVP